MGFLVIHNLNVQGEHDENPTKMFGFFFFFSCGLQQEGHNKNPLKCGLVCFVLFIPFVGGQLHHLH